MNDWLAGAILAFAVFLFLSCLFAIAARADVPMPAQISLIVCKVNLTETNDPNENFTGHRDSEWDMSEGVMHCKLIQQDLYDPSVDMGADPVPFSPMACMRAAMMLGPQFDVSHKNKPWRFYRAACPVPIHQTPDPRSPIVGWKQPGCADLNRATIVCDQDTAI